MITVYKYDLSVGIAMGSDVVTIDMHYEAKPIHADLQYGQLRVWAVVDTLTTIVKRRFMVVGTGHPMDVVLSQVRTAAPEGIPLGEAFLPSVVHVGTFFASEDRSLVFHVFDLGEV